MARPKTISDAAVLRATGRAIGRFGPAGLTLAAVAAEAGLSPATLVQRFGSKRGLLLAFARDAEQAVGAPFQRARQEHASPLAGLHAALAASASTVTTPEERAGNLGVLQLDLTDAEFRGHAAGSARRMHAEIADLLVDAVTAGELRFGVDTTRLARLIQLAYNGALVTWALAPDVALVELLRVDLTHLLQPYRTGHSLSEDA